MKVLDLFSGIGGFSLGLERAGMETVAFCEYDEKCRQVLKKHWPDVPQYTDVRTMTAEQLRNDGITDIGLICGGFPCQDLSIANRSYKGLAGERSGLWVEYKRIIGEIRPRFVLIENVTALLARGFERVLSDLAALGFDAEWHCIPAAYVGAKHIRDRVWVIAYPSSERLQGPILSKDSIESTGCAYDWCAPSRASDSLNLGSWSSEPTVLRGDDDVPGWMDRIKQLGNAVVPQIPEIIGRAIMEAA